jgi:hypothetical protein
MNYKNKNKMAVRVIRAVYSGPESTFIIPKNLPLLSQEDNAEVGYNAKEGDADVPFHWWIKWDTLYYYNKDGQLKKIEKSDKEIQPNLKFPQNVTDEEVRAL